MILKMLGSIFTVILIAMVITSIAEADTSKKAPTVHNLDSNSVPAILTGSPNILTVQADTIMLSSGGIVHRWDDSDRQNTCYIVNSVSISCVPRGSNGRR